MIGTQSGAIPANMPLVAVAVVLGLLFLFGAAYNLLVAWLEHKGYDEGYTSLLVVGGVLVTLAASALLVGWYNALLVLLCFAASGLPMILGSLARYARARRAALDHALAEIKGLLKSP